MLIGKGSKLNSIIQMKCPKCQKGDFFISHPYNLKRAGDIYTNCPNCGVKYSKEPGFYYGAMYVNYALGVALFVSLWVSFNLFFPNVTVGWQIAIIILLTVLLTPYLYALSKIIWANMFIRYEKNFKN